MKKFFSFLCALTIVLSASAAPLRKVIPQKALSNQPIKAGQVIKPVAKAPQAKAGTPLASGTFYTIGGEFYAGTSSGWSDATSEMPSIEVTVEGDQVSIVGLAYWFPDGAVTGTLAGNTVTIPNGQLVGTDEYGDEFLIGSDDAETVCDIVFEYDPEEGTLSAVTTYILESASATAISPYCYWYAAQFGLQEPEAPEVVAVPEGLEASLYKFEGTDKYYDSLIVKYVFVAFDGNDVYIQGMSDFIADGWIKGAKDGDSYAFPAVFLGTYESYYGNYDIYSQAASMSFDASKNQFVCQAFNTTASGYLMDEYENITLSKFTEVAATPSDPEFTKFAFAGETYPKVGYNIPLVGTQNEDLSPEKLSYAFFIQKGNEESPLVLTTDLYTKIASSMTEIPYTFSDDWDIYSSMLYLNQSEAEVRSWDKLGLQTIYRGAGEEHKSNIVWYDVKAYWADVDKALGIENIVLTEQAQKVVVDGAVYIIRDNKLFNLQGAQVR